MRPHKRPRTHKGTTKPHADVLPGALQRRIAEAGASAYAWYDSELEQHLDPTERWRRLTTAITVTAGWVSALSLIALAWSLGVASGVLVAVLLGVGFVLRGFQRVPLLSWWAAGLVTAWPTVTAGAPGNALVLIMLIAPLLAHRQQRATVTAMISLVAAVTTAALPSTNAGAWAVVLIVAGVSAVFLYCTGARSLPQPWHRLTSADITALIPHPSSRVPWLVRWANGRGMKNIPQEIRRKQAGAVGERKTALYLLGMRRGRGTAIAHDVLIPEAKSANADHVVLAPSGLFVVDTKQFGRESDPGVMTVDSRTGEIVHDSQQGRRPVTKSLETAVWAAKSIAAALGVSGRARVVLAVHRASVARGLRTQIDGVVVEVLPAVGVGERIDAVPGVLGRRELATARFRLGRLQAASSNLAPLVVGPLGARGSARQLMQSMRQAAEAAPAAAQVMDAPVLPGDTEGMWDDGGAVTAQLPVVSADPEPRPEPEPASARVVAPASTTAEERLRDRWTQMVESPAAAPDDVPAELRDLWRGHPITLLIPTQNGDVSTMDAVAMTGPCQGVSGSFIWFCAPEQYAIYLRTHNPVAISTISTERIVRKNLP